MITELKNVLLDDFWIMPQTPKYTESGIPYVTSKNIKGGKIDFENVNYISIEDYKKISKNRPILKNDILISMIGTLGEAAMVDDSYGEFYGQNMFLVRLDSSKIDYRYFINFFKSPYVKNHLARKQNKSTQSYLKANHIESLMIPVVTIKEQEEIANQLDKVQEIIKLKTQQIEKLEELIKSQFVEMFGDIKNNDRNWNTKKGSDLFIFSSGKGNTTSNLSNDFEYKCYGGNGITGLSKDYLIDYDTLVIGRVGAYCGSVHKTEGKVWITDNAIYIKEFKEKNNIKFLEEMFKVIDFHRFANFSGQPKITQQPLQNYDYILPPIELQNQFAEFVKQIDKQKFEIENSLKEMQELYESLMDKYFG